MLYLLILMLKERNWGFLNYSNPKVKFWKISNLIDDLNDTSTHAEIRSCFIVCDLSNPESIEKLNELAEGVRSKTSQNDYKTLIYVVGNDKKTSNIDEEESKKINFS